MHKEIHHPIQNPFWQNLPFTNPKTILLYDTIGYNNVYPFGFNSSRSLVLKREYPFYNTQHAKKDFNSLRKLNNEKLFNFMNENNENENSTNSIKGSTYLKKMSIHKISDDFEKKIFGRKIVPNNKNLFLNTTNEKLKNEFKCFLNNKDFDNKKNNQRNEINNLFLKNEKNSKLINTNENSNRNISEKILKDFELLKNSKFVNSNQKNKSIIKNDSELKIEKNFKPEEKETNKKNLNNFSLIDSKNEILNTNLFSQFKEILSKLNYMVQNTKLKRNKKKLKKNVDSLFSNLNIEISHFLNLKKLLMKIMKAQLINEEDMKLSEIEFLMFCIFIVKKKFIFSRKIEWSLEFLNSLQTVDIEKRSEQNCSCKRWHTGFHGI